jgi:hypothetical protein
MTHWVQRAATCVGVRNENRVLTFLLGVLPSDIVCRLYAFTCHLLSRVNLLTRASQDLGSTPSLDGLSAVLLRSGNSGPVLTSEY